MNIELVVRGIRSCIFFMDLDCFFVFRDRNNNAMTIIIWQYVNYFWYTKLLHGAHVSHSSLEFDHF